MHQQFMRWTRFPASLFGDKQNCHLFRAFIFQNINHQYFFMFITLFLLLFYEENLTISFKIKALVAKNPTNPSFPPPIVMVSPSTYYDKQYLNNRRICWEYKSFMCWIVTSESQQNAPILVAWYLNRLQINSNRIIQVKHKINACLAYLIKLRTNKKLKI